MTRKPMSIVLVLAGLCAAAPAAAQTVYKWTDAGGRVQYTNTPPPAGVPFSTLGPPPAPDAEAASQARARAQRSIDEAARAADERRRAQTQRDAQAESDRVQGAERQRRCAAARHDLQLLQRGGPVFHYDERGQRVYVDDKQRDAETARMRAAVEQWCTGTETGAPPAPSARSQCAAAREALADLSAPGARAVPSDLAAARQRADRACAGQP